jgi:phospholipid transport system transporter-binding protein
VAFVPQKTNVEVIEASPDRLDVRGALTFNTARRAYDEGLRVLRKVFAGGGAGAPLEVDCAGVTESDSAGLAVLIEWLASAARAGRKVRFTNLPEGIRAAAQISGVEELLAAGI